MSDEAILLKLLGRTGGTGDGSNEPYVDHDRTHLVIDGHFTLTDAEATRVAQLLATSKEQVEEPPHEYPTCSLPPCEEPGVECFDYPLRISSTLTLAAPAWLCEQHQRQFPWTRRILDLGDIDAAQ